MKPLVCNFRTASSRLNSLKSWSASPKLTIFNRTLWEPPKKEKCVCPQANDIQHNPPTPLAAGGARQRRNYQQQGPRSHYKQQGQEARKQERRSKKQEGRSNCRQQAARSKKQEARKQQAAGRQVRELVFLSIQKATLGTAGGGPQALSVPQGPAVSVWRARPVWAVAAGRQVPGGRSPQARSVPQDPAVLAWQARRVWALAAGRQVRQLAFL